MKKGLLSVFVSQEYIIQLAAKMVKVFLIIMVFIKVFSVLLLAYIAPDRVMVRIFDRTVYGTVIGFLIGADQNIVYPEIEFIQIIGDTQSPAGLCESVIQLLCKDAMGVRNGSVVEVATGNNSGILAVCNDAGYGIRL